MRKNVRDSREDIEVFHAVSLDRSLKTRQELPTDELIDRLPPKLDIAAVYSIWLAKRKYVFDYFIYSVFRLNQSGSTKIKSYPVTLILG